MSLERQGDEAVNKALLNETSSPTKQIEHLNVETVHKSRLPKCLRNLINHRGVFYALLSAFFISITNIFIRKATFFSAGEISFIRYLLQLIIMLVYALWEKESIFGKKGERFLLTLRGVFGTIGLITIYFSVKLINPSDAVALINCAVIFVTIFGRIFLKEKLTIVHLIALVVTFVGIILISQPTFIFTNKIEQKPKIKTINLEQENSLNILVNNSNCASIKFMFNHTDPFNLFETMKNKTSFIIDSNTNDSIIFKNSHSDCLSNIDPKYLQIMGISLALIGAFAYTAVSVILKKLANKKAHLSVVLLYASYFGLPVSFAISVIMIATGAEKKSMEILKDRQLLILNIIYSALAGVLGVGAQIFMNLSLKTEDASKMSLLKSTDLIYTFLFQYLFLDILSNMLNTIGAILIFCGASLVMIFKIVDQKHTKNRKKLEAIPEKLDADQNPVTKPNLFIRMIFYKF